MVSGIYTYIVNGMARSQHSYKPGKAVTILALKHINAFI